MNALSINWQITKISFSVINQDRELIWFALLSFISSALFGIAMIVPSVIPTIMNEGLSGSTLEIYQYVIIFITYFGLAFIATFFNVCVVYTAKVRFAGGNATFGESLGFVFSKVGLIIQWSLLSASVGLLLRILDSLAARLGKIGQVIAHIIIGLLGMAWSVLTIFVVPVLVYEGLGPINAIKKSTQIIKKTWGESLIKSIGLGLIQFFAFVIVAMICIAITYLLSDLYGGTGVIIGIIIMGFMLLLTGLIFSVASTIFNTALYVYANESLVASGFDEDIIKGAFKQKG